MMKNNEISKNIMVVGDKFSEFSNGKDVVTISQLELITQIPAHIIDANSKFIVGQGVRDDYAGKVLENQQRNQNHGNKLDLSELKRVTASEKNTYSHKKMNHNTLIGIAEKVDENLFALPLLIDERCELMSDHQTGQHIQGMILVEACRQTFIAVTEEFYLSGNVGKSYYVINDMNIRFESFLFPLPAMVHYELVEQNVNERRSRFKANIRISQHTTLCASMTVSFTVYPASVIGDKEAVMAADMTRTILQTADAGVMSDVGRAHA
ncbi:AfsA-related hotdog domain-containing protein [Serratia sp. NPDC078593]|uniref:AfsA-related hotdog domain-containing protein n=1 Tax=unclassified Serratia (in: enterobacteria) TaxID=2647522 RepID=UPI0037D7086D